MLTALTSNSSIIMDDSDTTHVNATIIGEVTTHLPHFKAACDRPDADMVILNQLAFGNSAKELRLLALAVKYAGLAGKTVVITCGPNDVTHDTDARASIRPPV